MAKNHLFSFKNSYGEKMYAIVVGAKSAQAARSALPDRFNKFEGTVEGVPKTAFDADVFYADKSERRYDYDPDDPDTAMEIERERKYDLKSRPQAEKDKEEDDAVRYEAEQLARSQKFQKRNESKAAKFNNFLESLNGEFHVVLRHGDQNKQKTEDDFTCSSPHEAAKKFLAKYFPKEDLYSVRVERTLEGGKQSWSAGTSASGQRIWIYEK